MPDDKSIKFILRHLTGGNRKLWTDVDVTAVELNPEIAKIYQDFFPDDKVIVADAHEYLLNNYQNFDFIWSSPPCQSHSDLRRCVVHRGQNEAIYPEMELYQEIILLKNFAPLNCKWVIENVIPYYEPLIRPTKKLHRHYYWSNFYISDFTVTDKRKHQDIKGTSVVYGFDINGFDINEKRKLLRNMVDPELGLHILNCGLQRIDKTRVQQTELFVPEGSKVENAESPISKKSAKQGV